MTSRPKKDALQKPQNFLERLIRLDKRVSVINSLDDDGMVRPECSLLNENVNEPLLQIYWRQMNGIYFAPINHLEIQKLRLIFNGGDDLDIVDNGNFSNYNLAWALESMIGKEFFKANLNPILSMKNRSNFIKLLYFLSEVSPLLHPNLLDSTELLLYPEAERSILLRKIKKCNISAYLKEEEQHLDSIMKLIPLHFTEFDEVIDDLENELYELKVSNGENILKLSKLIQLEIKSFDKNKAKEDLNNEILRDYLQKELLQIEVNQISESLIKILEVKKLGNDYYYLIEFEQSFSPHSCWISEKNLIELDKYREVSTLTLYTIPQKSPISHISQNFYGFNRVMESLNSGKLNFPRGISLLDFMRDCELQGNNYPYFFNEFAACHHCKLLFHKKRLIKCNYSSTQMGLPSFTKNSRPFYMPNSKELSNKILRKTIRKRNCDEKKRYPTNKQLKSYGYDLISAEILCDRYFCRFCLKMNYETNVDVASQKKDWICPFCTGVCFCTRCIRNDFMNRVRNMFLGLGGTIEEVNQNSLFNQFIDPEFKNSVLKLNNQNYFNGKKPPNFISLQIKAQEIDNEKEILSKSYENFISATKISTQLEQVKAIIEEILQREEKKIEIVNLEEKNFQRTSKKKQANKICKIINMELNKLENSTDISNSSKALSIEVKQKIVPKFKTKKNISKFYKAKRHWKSNSSHRQFFSQSTLDRKREKLLDLIERDNLIKQVKNLLIGEKFENPNEPSDAKRNKDIDKLIESLNKNYLMSLKTSLMTKKK